MPWLLQHKLVFKSRDHVSKHSLSHSPYPPAETAACPMLTTRHKQRHFLQLLVSVFQDSPKKPSFPLSLGWASWGSTARPLVAEVKEKQSHLSAAGLLVFGNRHSSLEGCWGGQGHGICFQAVPIDF